MTEQEKEDWNNILYEACYTRDERIALLEAENQRLRDAVGILTARNPDKWGHWLYDSVEAQDRALALLQEDKL